MSPPAIQSEETRAPATHPARYRGEAVYLYAFDVAYEMTRSPVKQLLGHPVAEFFVDASKRSPRDVFFYRPQMVRLLPEERIGPHGAVRVERTVKLLPVGAISITIRVPFEVGAIGELVAYHDLAFSNGSLHDEVHRLAAEVQRELAPFCVRPATRLAVEEAYTVFCLHPPSLGGARFRSEEWLRANQREVASLLTQEPGTDHLSAQEADESTGKFLSYYDHDLLVLDWDAALLIDEPVNFDETLYVLELANLQLAELEAYDRILDESLTRAYTDLRVRPMRSRAGILRELREIRIDMARFSDELSNITKFFGDWHLARIYQAISTRFHLADWHKTIGEKLRTLNDLYQLLNQDRSNQLMLVLEVTIVLLFLIDLVILVMGLKH